MQSIILKWRRFVTISRLLLQAYYLYRRNQKDKMYNLIGDELFRLGGVYIKFLQGVILQSWMMQRWRSERKLDIFEKIDNQNLDMKKILQANLGSKKMSQLQNICEQPFAIGSFGHVYKAQLKNGQPIIIKILSPSISQTLKFDLRLLQFFWFFHLKSIRFRRGFNFKLIFDDFKKQTLNEIDYIKEAKFAHSQYLTYKKHKHLVIPKTYLDLSTKEIIVQDYIKGISVTQLLKLRQKKPKIDLQAYVKNELDSNLVQQLQTLAYEIFWGTFHYPQVMGDPHPGNVILLKNNQIALIDFGISAQAAKEPAAYLNLLKACHALSRGEIDIQKLFLSSFQFFGRDLYLALTKLSKLYPEEGSQVNFNQELAKVIEKVFDDMYSDDHMKGLMQSGKGLIVFNRLTNKNNNFGFRFKIEDAEMLRALVTLTSLIDVLGLYPQVMSSVYDRVIKKVEEVHPDLQSLNDPEISHSQALNIVFAWLERVAAHDPGLFKNLMAKMHFKSKAWVEDKVNSQD